MPYNQDLTWEEALSKMLAPARVLIREIAAAQEVRNYLVDAQDSLTDLAWGRILFECADTKNITLSVVASTKTISCQTGQNAFVGFKIGRNAQVTNFTNAGNNVTSEITAVTNDSITLGNETGMVDETDDANARVQENPEQFELDKIDALQAALVAIDDINKTLNGTAVSSVKDNAALLRDFA